MVKCPFCKEGELIPFIVSYALALWIDYRPTYRKFLHPLAKTGGFLFAPNEDLQEVEKIASEFAA